MEERYRTKECKDTQDRYAISFHFTFIARLKQGYPKQSQAGLNPGDYIAFGLAQCYRMEDGILTDIWLLEPLTGATLECLHGIGQAGSTRVSPPTSYKRVLALRAGPLHKR